MKQKEIKLYKLKHKATGLYFIPSRGNGNLSVKGKIYVNTKPSLTWGHVLRIQFKWKETEVSRKVCKHWGLEYSGWKTVYVKTMTPDWEIEEIQ